MGAATEQAMSDIGICGVRFRAAVSAYEPWFDDRQVDLTDVERLR